MTEGIKPFLALPEQDRRDVFEAAAARLDTLPGYVEKDFWVCLVLDALFNRRPEGHPRLLFKGGTSLSKAFGLIGRFSEDIDLVVFRDGLGFEGERDPTVASGLSNKKRAALFKDLGAACREYIRGALQTALASRIDELATDCQIVPDEGHVDGQTLFIEYPTLFPSSEVTYVAPRVKIEAGARSALRRDIPVDRLKNYVGAKLWGMQLFMGGKGTGSRFHCASQFNLFLMARGVKEWLFAHPRASVLFQPRMNPSGIYSYSDLYDRRAPNERARALFERIPLLKTSLSKGDALLNPPWWWHSVRNATPQTIAISTRWEAPYLLNDNPFYSLVQFLTPYQTRLLLHTKFGGGLKDSMLKQRIRER